MKRILTVQDISCVGKCSLTVALPIISAAGVETAVLPTALLSSHTAFDSFTFDDLTDRLPPILEKFRQQKLAFDAVYSGYLGSKQQVALVEQLFSDYSSSLKIVDPAIGDNGKLYSGFTPDFALAMRSLCSHADIALPNLTELCFMLGIEYSPCYTEQQIQAQLKELCRGGCRSALVTGVAFHEGKTGVYGYDGDADRFFSYENDCIDATFHGTGDCFASALTGAMMRGRSLEQAAALAADFTAHSIALTVQDPDHRWYGVNFEQALPNYIKQLED